MNKTTKTILWIVVAIIVIAGIWYGVSRKPAPAPTPTAKEPIKIGFIAPLTGDVATYGQGEKNAVEMAVEEINNAGGINNRPLKVIYEDGKCIGKEAVSAAQKLINVDKVKIILGGACSGETLAVVPIAERNKVILFSAFSTNPDITNAGDFVFRNAPSDTQGGKDAAEMIYNDGKKKIAILSENTDYAQGLRSVFEKEFKRLGGEIVADEFYLQGAKDFRTQLTKIKAANPEAIFFNPQSDLTGGLSVKQAKEMGITVPFYGGNAFSSDNALKIAGEALEGLTFIDPPGLNQKNPKAVKFLKKYKERYGLPSSDYEVGARYDSVYIIADALKKCGESTECIRDYLYNLKEYDGVIGKYHFDKNGDVVGIKYAVKKIIGGKPVMISE